MIQLRHFALCILFVFVYKLSAAQKQDKAVLFFDKDSTYQTMHNFAASDAWACQFVGNWPDEKRNAIADLLFSLDTSADGKPKGIGLSMWRYNIGAGSAGQGTASGIQDAWRRAASIMDNRQSNLVQAQNWFLSAAKERGVTQFLAFYNSPPVTLTNNKKAFATNGICNINSSNYKQFARSAISTLQEIEKSTGVQFDFLSPVNEPQWDWSDGGQEGCPYTNNEISGLVKSFNEEFVNQKINTKILLPEAGHINYFLSNTDKPGKDNQVQAFFNPFSPEYIGQLPSVYGAAAYHSYFSTSPAAEAINLRKKVKDMAGSNSPLQLWQTEYCILGDNKGEIEGNKRDLGMTSALYLAKVIQQDLVWANASAWQWWLAISPYDYKDGLIYVDKNELGGNYYESKMLWVLGNYSRFIRPGMVRVKSTTSDPGILTTAFKDPASGKLVIVAVNALVTDKPVALKKQKGKIPSSQKLVTYTTNEGQSLEKKVVQAGAIVLPARSVTTIIIE